MECSEKIVRKDKKPPKWEVYFNRDFLCHAENQSAGQEQPINVHFEFDGKQCHVPSVYACNEGLVLDCCIKISAEELRVFHEKHSALMANKDFDAVYGEIVKLFSQNPMNVIVTPEVTLNGERIVSNHGHAVGWNPCLRDLNTFEAETTLKHYGLDLDSGWRVWRYCFDYSELIEYEISSLSVTFKHGHKDVYGPSFKVSMPGNGDKFTFTHPITGEEHTLTVQSYRQVIMPEPAFLDKSCEYPTHLIQMCYTIYPNLPDGSFCINDFCRGDQMRKKAGSSDDGIISGMSRCIGLIKASGAEGIAFGGSEQGRLHVTYSATHFQPVDSVKWQLIFFLDSSQDTTVELV